MSQKLFAVARMSVHAGKEREFRTQAERVFQAVQGNEPGTFLYDWFISADGRQCTVIDGYENSEAVLAHLRNVGPLMRTLMAMCDVEVEFVGSPSAEVIAALRLKPEQIKQRLQGLA